MLAGYMIFAGGASATPEEGCSMAGRVLKSGAAFQTMKQFVQAQGGDVRALEDFSRLKQARFSAPCIAEQSGFVASIEADRIGLASLHLGAGRRTKDDIIDASAGLLLKEDGRYRGEGATCSLLYADDREQVSRNSGAAGAFSISSKAGAASSDSSVDIISSFVVEL